ncbi:MAG TPA: aldo/keto reductase [Planctomycetota bacterium]|nr:aldo/keto reductase [Planctomycetota bacterium]
MKVKNLGRTGLRVSELCLGCMTFGNEANEADSIAMINRAVEAGVNFLDTANVYSRGRSEEIVGKALAGRRERFVLATKLRGKMGDGPNDEGVSRYAVFQQVDASLRRLNTDHIDLYQVHSWDANTPLEETLDALNDVVRAGKVRYLGCSNFAAWQLAKALGLSALHRWARFDCIQPRYNLIDRVVEREHFPLCLDAGVGVINYSPLAGGILTGKYPPDGPPPPISRGGQNKWFMEGRAKQHNLVRAQAVVSVLKEIPHPIVQTAIKWTLAHPAVTSPIIGARDMAQLNAILDGWDAWELGADDKKRLDEVSELPPVN